MAPALLARMARGVPPGGFAITMATGIVSTALGQAGSWHWSGLLLGVTTATFVVLVVASSARAVLFPAELRADLSQPERAFTAFAFVAACDVLGVRLADDGHRGALAALTGLAIAAWGVLACLVPGRMLARARSAAIGSVNGSWFLLVVATQSLAIAGASLGPGYLTAAIAAWVTGMILYVLVSSLVLVRLARAGLGRPDRTAPYWVAMGAASITVLATATIITTGGSPQAGPGAMTGLAVAFWALATCLLLPLAVRSGWRHLAQSEPFSYRADLWMVVFPIGMYATAGMRLGAAARIAVLQRVGTTAVWPATAAWLVLFLVMLGHAIAWTVRQAADGRRPRPRDSEPGKHG